MEVVYLYRPTVLLVYLILTLCSHLLYDPISNRGAILSKTLTLCEGRISNVYTKCLLFTQIHIAWQTWWFCGDYLGSNYKRVRPEIKHSY